MHAPNRNLVSAMGIGVAAVALLAMVVVAVRDVSSFNRTSALVLHTQNVRQVLTETLSSVKDVETATRGYILTGHERFLEYEREGTAALDRLVPLLSSLMSDNPRQVEAFGRLRPLIDRKLQEVREGVRLRREVGEAEAEAHVASGRGKDLMDRIRSVVGEMLAEESQLLDTRLGQARGEARNTVTVLVGGFALCALLIGGATATVRRDMRIQAEAAQAIRRQAEEIKDLYNHAPCGYHSLDGAGRFVAINDTELAWLGYAREEVVGKLRWADLLSPEGQATFAGNFPVLKERGFVKDLEFEVRRKDGSVFPVLLNASALKDAEGRYVASRSTVFDMTERKQAERVREQARAYSENIVDTVREPLVILTSQLIVNSANRSFFETFGLTPDGAVGRPLATLSEGAWNIPALLTALAEIVPRHSELRDFEVTHEFPGLGRRVMVLNARKLYRPGNNTTLTLLAIEDVTERKAAESALVNARDELERRVAARTKDLEEAQESVLQLNWELEQRVRERTAQLENANKELESFSYSVSHDLRAPLRHIGGFAAKLGRHLGEERLDETSRRLLATISDAAVNMGRLIDDLLAFSQIGRADMRRVGVRLEELVAETRRALDAELTNRTVEWSVGPLPEVEGDPGLLRQVFINLLGNAVKYTRRCEQACIEVSANTASAHTAKDPEVVICVRDNGAGFDMKYAGKLFGVFQRLHSATEFEGTGVGLANVRRIVERHGGRIWAEAEVGKGASFFFTLPTTAPSSPAR